jgi:[ribosomal protein S18]-alanine N-acetyltransferase
VEKTIFRGGLPLYRVERMTLAHVSAVLDVERRSFPKPWSRGIFEAEVRNASGVSHPFVLVSTENEVAGYLCLWRVADELHVNNVSVAPERRGQGLGRALMEFAEEFARKHGCRAMGLEVRASNEAALRLYESLGFARAGVRKRYYEETGEDAVLMTKLLA